jgi:triacylglycerol esterase/lipase EstA (alpha/beta hydrolase family)
MTDLRLWIVFPTVHNIVDEKMRRKQWNKTTLALKVRPFTLTWNCSMLADGKLSLIGHSAGGWLARVYMEEFGTSDISLLLTLGSPLL